MNWWYRNVFIDRSLPLTGPASEEALTVKQKDEHKLWRLVVNISNAMRVKLQESLKSHYDWKVYKNLSDHQLDDIGLTRDGLNLLLHKQIPMIPEPRVKVAKKQKNVSRQTGLINQRDLEKAVELPRDIVCSNDCVEKVA
jgi:hypothetical protein